MKKCVLRAAVAYLCAAALTGSALAAEADRLVPVGQTVGLVLYTDGVYVVGLDESEAGCAAKDAGLRPGDRIVSVNGAALESAEALRAQVAAAGGGRLTLDVDRDGRAMSFSVRPRQEPEGWRLGLLVRDRITGLGTVTFYDPQTGRFGALGHGVGKSGSPGTAELRGGSALPSSVTGVTRGTEGTPGQLRGALTGRAPLGRIELNAPQGIFGFCSADSFPGEAIPVARREDVTTGPAEIWSNAAGGAVQRFSVEIEAVRFGTDDGRNLRLHVTDEALLASTGGIVQGMSGSPILQNGRLVGAVTHVLIRDPTRGYGIWIDEMLQAAQQALPEAA